MVAGRSLAGSEEGAADEREHSPFEQPDPSHDPSSSSAMLLALGVWDWRAVNASTRPRKERGTNVRLELLRWSGSPTSTRTLRLALFGRAVGSPEHLRVRRVGSTDDLRVIREVIARAAEKMPFPEPKGSLSL